MVCISGHFVSYGTIGCFIPHKHNKLSLTKQCQKIRNAAIQLVLSMVVNHTMQAKRNYLRHGFTRFKTVYVNNYSNLLTSEYNLNWLPYRN
jgi:hypothetical protein